jgi:hypothetical protein
MAVDDAVDEAEATATNWLVPDVEKTGRCGVTVM